MNIELLTDDPAAISTTTTISTSFTEPSETTARPRTSARWFERVTPVQLGAAQWIAAAIMCYVVLCTPLGSRRGLLSITESWGSLERVALWQRSLSWLPGARDGGRFLELPPGFIVYSFRFMLLAMFAMQALAFWQAWSGRHTSFWKWLIGPVGAHIVMLLMVPSNADVFYYEMSGDLANRGFNPYLYPLYDFPDNPIYPYNHWVEMKTVYGPFWTDINRAIMGITGPDPVLATLAYKIFFGIVALALAVLVYFFAKRLTHNTGFACAAGVLVAWQPNMIFESSGQAHNDPVMMILMTAGVMLVIVGGIGAIRGALVLVTASAAIKYVTLPVIGLIGLLRLVDRRKPNAVPRILAAWVIDGIAILATLVVAFQPYWNGPDVLKEMVSEPGRLFTNPLWIGQGMALDALFSYRVSHWYYDGVRTILQLLMFATIAYAIYGFVRSLITIGANPAPEERKLPSWTGSLLIAWTICIAALAFVPANSHSWYWTWPVVPVALLMVWKGSSTSKSGDGFVLPRWFWGYLVLTMVMTMIYMTKVPHL